MTDRLRISVADDEQDMRNFLERMLPLCGHEVVSVAATGAQLVEHCRRVRPDLVITDVKMPDMDGIDASIEVCRERPVPFILVSAYHDAETIHRAEADYIMGFLVKPIGKVDLGPAIAVALRRFEQFQKVRREAADLRQALADRQIIEQAKTMLMAATGADEKEAFQRLQQLAADRNQRLVEAAKSILAMEKALRPTAT